MRKGGGKQKGAAFERECCKLLSLWSSGGSREDLYWRSAMSGGRSTVAHAKGKKLGAQAGDISCVDPLGAPLIKQFLIECKTYRDLKWHGLLTGKGSLVSFWDEAKKQALRYGKLPMLIGKQNQLPAFVCLTWRGRGFLDLESMDTVILAPKLDLRIYLLDDFLKKAVPP